MLFVCGNNVDLESAQALKKISQTKGISLISEQFLELDNTLLSNSRFNTSFSDVLNSDLCLTFGTNIRFEASLLNVRVKKRSKAGNFVKASVGLSENLTYPNLSLGNSISTLVQIAEGRHPFCKNLVHSKTPMIIIGSGIKKRLDSASIAMLVDSLGKYTNSVSNNWFGLNFLPLTSSLVGSSFAGIPSTNNFKLDTKKFVFCVGLDSYNSLFKKVSPNAFIVAQTPYSDSLLKEADLILPSTSFLEKEGTFLNLEGRVQKTAVSLKGPNLARHDYKILKAVFGSNYKKVNKALNFFNNFEKNKILFTKDLHVKVTTISKKFFKGSFKSSLSNFFITNAITKNSVVMSKCFLISKQNYSNFV